MQKPSTAKPVPRNTQTTRGIATNLFLEIAKTYKERFLQSLFRCK